MRHLACLLAISLAACVADTEGSSDLVTLYSPDDDGKADSISGKQIVRDVFREYWWSPASTEGPTAHSHESTNMVYDNGEVVEIAGAIFETKLVGVNTFDVSAKMLTHFTTKLGVQILKKGPDGWVTVECGPQRHNYFTAFSLNRAQRVVKVNGTRTYTLRDCGLDADGSFDRIGVFVLPISTWGSLNGYYNYLVTETCDGGACSY